MVMHVPCFSSAIISSFSVCIFITIFRFRDTLDTRDTRDSGSLVSLNLANNNLTRGKSDVHGGFETDMAGVTALADALPKWYVSPARLRFSSFSHQFVFSTCSFLDIHGTPWTPPGSVALASLNLAHNFLEAQGAKHIAEVLPKW
jgi:hypothetical protein